MPLTPEDRARNGRLGAHVMHAAGKTNTAPARRAALARFERQVDPDGTLDPAVRARRASHAQRAHMISMSAKAAESRRRKAS